MASFMKKIDLLIISLYYPPIRSIASNRIYSFAKYLDKDTFNIHVIALDEEIPASDASFDEHLVCVTVHRIPNRGLLRRAAFRKRYHPLVHKLKAIYNRLLSLLLLDEYGYWRRSVVRKSTELIHEHNIGMILSSYAPVACHLAALELKKRFPHLRWIADMRDEMSTNPFLPAITRRRMRKAERDVLDHADAITSVSKPILEHFRSGASRSGIRFLEVRNGYDFDLPTERASRGDTFVIAYTGSFYGKYTPRIFFEALDQLVRQKGMNDVRVRVVGPVKPIGIPHAIKGIVSFEAPVPHTDALTIMQKSDLLLLYHPHNHRKGYYSGKLFEYMAALQPVLAIVDPEDVAAELVKKSRTGFIAPSNDVEGVAQAILQAYTAWAEQRRYTPDLDTIRRHHRKEQCRRLEDLILERSGTHVDGR